MKRFSKIFIFALVLVTAVSCSMTKAASGDIKEVSVPAAYAPAADTPAADTPAADVPAADVPAADVPAADVPAADVPAADVPAADTPAADASASADVKPIVSIPKVWQKELEDGSYIIAAASDEAVYISVPAYIGAEQVEAFVRILAGDFPSLLSNAKVVPSKIASYEVDGVSKDDASLVLVALDFSYDYYAALAKGEKLEKDLSVSFNEDGSLRYTVAIGEKYAYVDFYEGVAYITYPEDVNVDTIIALREAFLVSYPKYFRDTVLDYTEDGRLSVTYPESRTYLDIIEFIDASRDDVKGVAAFLASAGTDTTEFAEAVKSTSTTTSTSSAAATVKAPASDSASASSSIDLPSESAPSVSSTTAIISIIIAVLLVTACAYYFLIYRKSK